MSFELLFAGAISLLLGAGAPEQSNKPKSDLLRFTDASIEGLVKLIVKEGNVRIFVDTKNPYENMVHILIKKEIVGEMSVREFGEKQADTILDHIYAYYSDVDFKNAEIAFAAYFESH